MDPIYGGAMWCTKTIYVTQRAIYTIPINRKMPKGATVQAQSSVINATYNKNKLCSMTCGRVPTRGAGEINKILFQETDYSL